MDSTRRAVLIGGTALIGGLAATVGPTMCSMTRMKGAPETSVPARPSGVPQSMLDEDITPILARLDRWYSRYLSDPRYRFNPPATDASLDRLEASFGHRLPSAYRQLYRWHDGETDDRFGHLYGLPILPLADVAAELKVWDQVRAGFGGNRYAIPGAGWPEGAVDPAYSNPAWLPLTHDGSGNHIGIDFDPWPKGRIGQVIMFGRDQDVKVVIAPSLGLFLGWIADLLESGNFRLDVSPNEQVLRAFRLKVPAVDDFSEGARLMLGAPGQFL